MRGDARDPLTRIIVVDGIDAGVFNVEPRDGEHWLHMLYLLPQFQCKGIGRQLLTEVQANARTLGLPVRLQVMRANPARSYLYEPLGFVVYDETDQCFCMQWAA